MTPMHEVVEQDHKNFEHCISVPHKDHLVKKTNVRGAGFQLPLLEFNGACQGFGEVPFILNL